MIGVIDDVTNAVNIDIRQAGETVYIIGQNAATNDGWLSNSVYAHVIAAMITLMPRHLLIWKRKKPMVT